MCYGWNYVFVEGLEYVVSHGFQGFGSSGSPIIPISYDGWQKCHNDFKVQSNFTLHHTTFTTFTWFYMSVHPQILFATYEIK